MFYAVKPYGGNGLGVRIDRRLTLQKEKLRDLIKVSITFRLSEIKSHPLINLPIHQMYMVQVRRCRRRNL